MGLNSKKKKKKIHLITILLLIHINYLFKVCVVNKYIYRIIVINIFHDQKSMTKNHPRPLP